jgi:hypothetical protein
MLRSGRALLVVSLCVTSATACKKKKPSDDSELPTVAGSGVTSSQSRTLAPFTRLEVKGGLDVTVNVGKDAPLELHGDDNLFAHVKSTLTGGELTLEPDAVLKPAQAFRLTVGTARLDELGAAVAAKVTVHGVKSDAFTLRAGGAGQVTADGSAAELTVGARTASRVDLAAFSAAEGRVTAVEFARVVLGHLEKLEATQHGMATIAYEGAPELTTHADRPQNVTSRR